MSKSEKGLLALVIFVVLGLVTGIVLTLFDFIPKAKDFVSEGVTAVKEASYLTIDSTPPEVKTELLDFEAITPQVEIFTQSEDYVDPEYPETLEENAHLLEEDMFMDSTGLNMDVRAVTGKITFAVYYIECQVGNNLWATFDSGYGENEVLSLRGINGDIFNVPMRITVYATIDENTFVTKFIYSRS